MLRTENRETRMNRNSPSDPPKLKTYRVEVETHFGPKVEIIKATSEDMAVEIAFDYMSISTTERMFRCPQHRVTTIT